MKINNKECVINYSCLEKYFNLTHIAYMKMLFKYTL